MSYTVKQLAKLSPEFKKFYDSLHPKLLSYIVEAMQIFAENEL
jgi:hypothetical protein